MGYPITDPYWVRAKVGGVDRDILAQLFERRVLTYTPSNAAGFQVEMGNVGQHYFQWRYPALEAAWASTGVPFQQIYFASTRNAAHWEVWAASPPGGYANPITGQQKAETVPYSVQRAFVSTGGGPARGSWLLVDSRRGDGAHRQLYAISLSNYSNVLRLTYTDGAPPEPASPFPRAARPANDYNPAVSPDGSKIAFISDRSGQPQLYLMSYRPEPFGTVGDPAQLTSEGCVHQAPSWSPDGRRLLWAANCDGDYDIYQAEVRYTEDSRTFAGRIFRNNLAASLVNVRKLTNNGTDDQFPRFSPDGTTIAFEGQRDGVAAVYLMNADGAGERRLTNGTTNESAPSWSPDGRQLVFASQQDKRWVIEVANRDGSGRAVLATDPNSDNRWPVWAQ